MLPRSVQADFEELRRKLDELRRVDPEVAGEVHSMAAQYLVVAIAGKLEQGLKAVLQDYTSRRSNISLDRAIARLCESFQNPRPDKILELVNAFDKDARQKIEQEWESDDNRLQQSVKALVSTRINIAHQKTRYSRVSLESLDEFYSSYKAVLKSVSETMEAPAR